MRKIKVLIGTALTLPVLVLSPVAVFAAPSPIAETKQAETMAQRVEKSKLKFAPKLTAEQTVKIKGKCKASQVISKALSVQLTRNNTKRTAAYTEITAALTEAIASLKANKDTTDLEAQSKVLSTKIAKYTTDMTAYQTAITDLSGVDCATDPVAFKAALEEARAARKTVADDVVDIRTYINTTIKKSLKELKPKTTKPTIETNTSTSNETNTETTGGGQ